MVSKQLVEHHSSQRDKISYGTYKRIYKALHRNVECLFHCQNGVNIGFMGFPGDLEDRLIEIK